MVLAIKQDAVSARRPHRISSGMRLWRGPGWQSMMSRWVIELAGPLLMKEANIRAVDTPEGSPGRARSCNGGGRLQDPPRKMMLMCGARRRGSGVMLNLEAPALPMGTGPHLIRLWLVTLR